MNNPALPESNPSIENQPYLERSCPTCGDTRVHPSQLVASAPPAESLPFPELQASWRAI